MKRHFLPGDELFDVEIGEVTMAVLNPVPVLGRIKVLDLQKNSDAYIGLEELRGRIGAGNLSIRRKGELRVPIAHQNDENLDVALQSAMGLSRRLKEMTTSKCISTNQAYKTLKSQHEEGPDASTPFPSRATVYRYLDKGRNGLPLLCGNKNKGNRQPRYAENVTALVSTLAQNHLLQQESRWTIGSLTAFANQVAHDEQLLGATAHMSRKYVRKVIFDNLSSDIELDRMDPRMAAAAKSIAKHRIRVSAPLMRVEQDAVHLPWAVRTPHGETSNIWLIHAIDCYTGMPVGWQLVVGSPTVSQSLQCVESILFSKKERFAALGLDYEMDCYGTPSLLVFDNGAETKGERMRKLTRLGIDPMHCKSRHAHGKPFIERLNRSLKEALETLPGCTRLDAVDGMRNPQELKDLPMSLEELEKWIVRWYFETWANTVLKRLVRSVFIDEAHLGSTPWARWKTVAQEHGYAMPLPPELDIWRMAKYEHEVRTLSRKTGLTYSDFNFRGDNLPYLIKKHGENPVPMLVDPEDFRRVYVPDGVNKALVVLVNADVDETTPAYSFEQAKALIKEVPDRKAQSLQAENFKRDVFSRSTQTSAKAARAQKKSVVTSRETTQRARQSSALTRARDNPLAPSAPSAPTFSGAPQPQAAAMLEDIPVLPVLNRKSGKEQA